MAFNVTTEWEDLQVKFGNYLPREKDPTTEEITKVAIETIENYDHLEKKNVDELKLLEETNEEDEEVIKEYMEKRMRELKELASKPKYGRVVEIRKQDFIQEVNNAPKDVYVVIHLYQTFNDQSNMLAKIFDSLAQKFPFVKFIKIVATNCIENYRDEDVPGLIIYKDGSLYKQILPAGEIFGGKKMSWKSKQV